MQLKINDKVITQYEQVSVSLKYDSIASTFGFSLLFEPGNKDRSTYLPGAYSNAEISYNGERLITGQVLSQSFSSAGAPPKSLVDVGGYSTTGFLEDCQVPLDAYPLQLDNKSLSEIIQTVLFPLNIKFQVDESVKAEADTVYPTVVFEQSDSIKDFLARLTSQKNIVLSHTATGQLLLTRADVNKKPIFNFDGGQPALKMNLKFNGQMMHDVISVIGQQGINTANAAQSQIENPYVQKKVNFNLNARNSTVGNAAIIKGNRPKVALQTAGNDNDTPLVARGLLGQELKAIRLTIEIQGWTLNGKLVRPNNIITVVNPELFLFQKSKWFIESVDFTGNNVDERAILSCVLPECYSNTAVANIFTGSNLTAPYSETGAHATITPFI